VARNGFLFPAILFLVACAVLLTAANIFAYQLFASPTKQLEWYLEGKLTSTQPNSIEEKRLRAVLSALKNGDKNYNFFLASPPEIHGPTANLFH